MTSSAIQGPLSGPLCYSVTRWRVFCHPKALQSRPARFKQVYSDKAYNHYEIYVFINENHVSKINYNYKLFPHKVHTAKGFYLPFGLYQMPNEFRSLGQYNITAKYQNVGFYKVKTPKR